MSSKRNQRRRGCEGKHRHADRAEALRHLWSARQAYQDNSLQVYRCDFGRHWHVGHPPRNRKLRRADLTRLAGVHK